MKLKSLFIIPMITPILITAANASPLPDEINYEPYKVQYDQLAAEVDVVTGSLNSAKEQLQYAYNQEAALYIEIQNLVDANADLQSQVESQEERRDILTENAEDLQTSYDRLNRRINGLERDRNETEREILREERRLAPLQDKIARIENRLVKKNTEVASARRSFEQVQRVSQNLRTQLNNLKAQRKTLKAQLTKFETQLETIDTQIEAANTALSSIGPKLAKAEATVVSQTAKRAKLATEIKAHQVKLGELMRADRANPEIKKIRLKIVTKTKKMKEAQVQIANANKQVKALNARKTKLTANVSRLTSQKTTLPGQIKRTSAALKTKKELIATRKIEVGNAETVTAERRADVDALALEANNIQTRLNRSNQELVRESRTRAILIGDLNETNETIRSVGYDLQQTSNNLNATNEQLDNIAIQIPQLERSISLNKTEISQRSATLSNTQDKIASLNSRITELDEEQATAMTSRDRKYQEYLSRYNYYGEKLSEAKTIGASQTDVALSIAKTDSNKYSTDRSSELGTKMGNEVATAQSQLWSAVRAEIKGYFDGYKVGHASTVDQTRGETEGTKAGTRAAIDYADRVLKPQFFNNIFASKIQSSQFKINEIVESIVKSMERVEAQEKGLMDAYSSVAPISASELEQSINVRTSLDQSIETFKTNLTQVLQQKMTMGEATSVYQQREEIPYTEYSCSNVYKNIEVFEKACDSSFFSTFKTKYTTEFYANFEAQYNNLYNDVTETTRTEAIEELYSAGLEKFYPVAKDSGIADGKADIYKESYTDAKTAAYNNQLPSSRATAEMTAGEEVRTWISSNATLTLKGAKVTDTDLVGGSRAKITLKVKNISPTNLSRPVKVIITKATNAKFANTEMYIKIAPGSNTIDFKDINFTVNPEARSNQPIVVEGKVILSGGKYNAERVETFKATATTAMNPAVKVGYEFNSTPQVQTRFRRRAILHNFDATVSPKIEDVRAGYTVKLSAQPGYESMIRLSNTTQRTGTLNFGYSKKIRYQYTFPTATRGKQVKLRLDYSHNGKVIKSELITLKPF